VTLSIRARLTLWYTVVLSAVLLVLGVGLYVAESHIRLSQLDDELGRGCLSAANLVVKELDEGADLLTAAQEAQEDFPAQGRVFGVYDVQGALLTHRPVAGLAALTAADMATSVSHSRSLAATPGDWRVHAQRYEHAGRRFYVAGAQPLDALQREREILGRTLTIGIPLALVLAGAGGWLIARRALAPVGLMASQARQISDRTPGFRLTVSNPHDEIGVLARAFNELLGRLERTLQDQRRFMADASHELRTPVSVARTVTDVTLGQPRSADEYREALVTIASQTRRLARMVDDMFTLARADAGALTPEPTAFYIDELLAECVSDVGVLAREKGVDVQAQGAQEIGFRGDERLLRQMFLNLLHNAVCHTPSGGRVDVRLAVTASALEVEVADTGCGIPPDERERIFERFVRLNGARGLQGGAGLGLAITRSIAGVHGGTVAARSETTGSTFVVRLPRFDAAREAG
jgi:two-component system, OmpR family, sensor kinase